MTRNVKAPSNIDLSCSESSTVFWCWEAIVKRSTTLNLQERKRWILENVIWLIIWEHFLLLLQEAHKAPRHLPIQTWSNGDPLTSHNAAAANIEVQLTYLPWYFDVRYHLACLFLVASNCFYEDGYYSVVVLAQYILLMPSVYHHEICEDKQLFFLKKEVTNVSLCHYTLQHLTHSTRFNLPLKFWYF